MKPATKNAAVLESVEKLILEAIASDYEEFVNILEAVQEGTDNEDYGRGQLVTALEKLIKKGLAQSYRYESGKWSPSPLSKAKCDELWFKATPKGTEMVHDDHPDLDE